MSMINDSIIALITYDLDTVIQEVSICELTFDEDFCYIKATEWEYYDTSSYLVLNSFSDYIANQDIRTDSIELNWEYSDVIMRNFELSPLMIMFVINNDTLYTDRYNSTLKVPHSEDIFVNLEAYYVYGDGQNELLFSKENIYLPQDVFSIDIRLRGYTSYYFDKLSFKELIPESIELDGRTYKVKFDWKEFKIPCFHD